MGWYIRKKREANYEKKFFINGTFDDALKAAIKSRNPNKDIYKNSKKKK